MSDPYHALRADLVSRLKQAARTGGQPKGQPATAPRGPSDFLPVDTSGVGEFPWEWNTFGTFNADTWHFLNTVASRSQDGVIQLSPGLTTWYYNIISATAYLWSDQDRAALDQHLIAAAAAQSQLITDYQTLFAPITPTDRAKAATALGRASLSNLSYVVAYRIGYEWSGRQAAGAAPLSAADLRNAQLDRLFAHAPLQAQTVLRPSLHAALQHEQAWAAQIDALWAKSRAIKDAAQNTRAPDPGNRSGMYTVDRGGVSVVRHSVSVSPPVNDIRAGLSSAEALEMSFSATRASSDDVVVATPGGAPSQVPAAVISVRDAQGAEKTLFSHDGTGDRAHVMLRFHGPTEIAFDLAPFEEMQATGWFFEGPVAEAAKNAARDVASGYQFQVPVWSSSGGQAEFGILGTLLVCREVTVQVVYPDGDLKRLSRSVPTGTGVSATLLGQMRLKGSSAQSVSARVATDQATGAPSLVLTAAPPGKAGTPGPLAHVIGARIRRPFGESAPAAQVRPAALTNVVAPQGLVVPQPFATAQALGPPPPPAQTAATPTDALVTTHERIFGGISAAQMRYAGARTKAIFILRQVLGADWSGRQSAGEPPLTLDDMRAARNLRSLFPDMPLEGAALLTELQAYLAATG